jgi:hypothetical protein|tara:strand:+ start:68 stop:289 length:222 start_codon:yes stop_codon:yes gene_type:complete
MTEKTAMDIALKALKKIEQHERECGLRWAEATTELRSIRNDANRNTQRWERLAWLVCGTLVTAIIAAWIKGNF